jgi:hypothetical protein
MTVSRITGAIGGGGGGATGTGACSMASGSGVSTGSGVDEPNSFFLKKLNME